MSTYTTGISAIDQDQCIGDSLNVINGNFSALDTSVATLFNTNNNYLQPGNVTYTTLSSDVQNRIAKAFINFDATTLNKRVSVGVSTITYTNPYYTVSFTNSMSISAYAVFISGGLSGSTVGNDLSFNIDTNPLYKTTSSFRFACTDPTTNLQAIPTSVYVLVFSI